MKKLLSSVLLLFFISSGYSQLVTNSTNTVAYYVQNVLLGTGVTVSNITINGGPANVSNPQIGEFNALNTNPFLGIDSGLVLASGDIAVAVGPNNSGSFSLGGGNNGVGDADLDLLEGTGSGTNDAVVLEFDFIPTGDTVIFDFVFGSEEYPEFVNGGFNDAFGFFLSGPGIVGPYSNSATNIALIPGTTTPVTIDNVNAGLNATYYVDNTVNTGPQSVQFDGYTTPITAVALVQCGVQYHIKIALADVGDAAWDSGVFLEGGSFSSNSTFSALNAVVPPNVTLCGAPYIVPFSAGPNPPPLSYWDFGDGLGTDTIHNPVYTYADTGTYTVMYVATDTASSICVGSDTAYFTVNIVTPDSLDAQFIIPPYDPCTDSLTVQLNFTGTGADSLYWSMGNGDTFINDTAISYTYTNFGVYVVTMEAYDTICNNTFTYTDTVFFNPNITTVNAAVPPNVLLCDQPYVVNFTGNTPAPPNSYWDFGDGSGTSTQNNPSYTYTTSGLYNVMYVAIDSSTCNIADTVNFQVQITIAPAFAATIDFDPPLPCSDLDSFLVELAFSGVGADSILWDLGDGTQLTTNSVSYVYPNPGTYTITMTAYNFLCGDESVTSEATFTEAVETESIIPNVFTPNDDGVNDKLQFIGIDNTQEYSIQIFSRWGNKVYEGTDALAHWDGNGEKAGTYFYILKYTDDCSKEEQIAKGTVTLFK